MDGQNIVGRVKTRILRLSLIANIRQFESGVRNVYRDGRNVLWTILKYTFLHSLFLVTVHMIECSFFDPSSMNILAFFIFYL